MLQCPEGRKVKGRIDYNFFGHHIVAHFAPEEVIGDKGRKIGGALATPLRHFGVVMTLEDFQKTAARMTEMGADWINQPSVTQKGTVREQMLMTVSDRCGNAIEFKGLAKITDVYAVRENESVTA
jgi:extradiol dioxygenase family protein